MISDFQNEINRYLAGHGTHKDLEDWLVANLERILASGDAGAIECANRIDVDLIRFGEGLIDRRTLYADVLACGRLLSAVAPPRLG